MGPRAAVAAGVLFYAALIGAIERTSGQTGLCCYIDSDVVSAGCGQNESPDPVPVGLGGALITKESCASTIIEALASLHSYDDQACYSIHRNYNIKLIFLSKATAYLPEYYKKTAENSDFRGAIYCDTAVNAVVLAFRGSVGLTPPVNQDIIDDWFLTNMVQHIGTRPLQYEVASDVAQLIRKDWMRGEFDGKCGSGRPKIILTGHSKGGGEAQFAASQMMLEAVVFNSDLVNPVNFTDWMQSETPFARFARSVNRCLTTQSDQTSSSGAKIRDVRMVNDFFATYVLPFCNLPHAPIEWLVDTLTCSANDGHGIATVIRELEACSIRPG